MIFKNKISFHFQNSQKQKQNLLRKLFQNYQRPNILTIQKIPTEFKCQKFVLSCTELNGDWTFRRIDLGCFAIRRKLRAILTSDAQLSDLFRHRQVCDAHWQLDFIDRTTVCDTTRHRDPLFQRTRPTATLSEKTSQFSEWCFLTPQNQIPRNLNNHYWARKKG